MKPKQYTCDDVEQLLHALAAQERQNYCEESCRMDDAMTHRLLDVINAELSRCSRMGRYKRWAQCAALVLMGALGIAYFSNGSAAVTPTVVPQEPMVHLPTSTSSKEEKKALLGLLDSTMESGFSPSPQETYAGRNHRHYGVSIYGSCEYTACTDTL